MHPQLRRVERSFESFDETPEIAFRQVVYAAGTFAAAGNVGVRGVEDFFEGNGGHDCGFLYEVLRSTTGWR